MTATAYKPGTPRLGNALRRLVACVCLLGATLQAQAQLAGRFQHSHPLIVVFDTCNAPYEYADDLGRAKGFHIDVISSILDQMLIPHRFVFRPHHEARQAIVHQEADLMLDVLAADEHPGYLVSKSVLSYFHDKDSLHGALLEEHLASYDHVLLDIMDNQLFRMVQSGEMEALHDKWFEPERRSDNASPMAVILTVAILLASVILTLVIRYSLKKARETYAKARETNRIMNQALGMGEYNVTEYDIESDNVRIIHGQMLGDKKSVSLEEYLKRLRFDADEAQEKMMDNLAQGKDGIQRMYSQWNYGTEDKPDWHHMLGHALTEKDEDGRPMHIISSITDIEALLKEQKENARLYSRYQQTFDASLIGMAMLSPDGCIIEANKEMQRIFSTGRLDLEELKGKSFFDLEFIRNDYNPASRTLMHTCCKLACLDNGTGIYVEMRLKPIVSDKGTIQNHSLTMRDVTDERRIYLELQRQDRELSSAAQGVADYDNKLKYLLENSNTYIWHSDIREQMVYYSRSMLHDDFSKDIPGYLELVSVEQREDLTHLSSNILEHQHSINEVHHFDTTILGEKNQWYNVVGLPRYDKEGNYVGHIGLMHNITDLVKGQQRLKEEAERAEDSGRQKSAFLANMTHEIRTPLNAIVGFADLLGTLESTEEKREFTNIIHQNCDILLRLINDILEASNMDSEEESITPESVDFPAEFRKVCKTLAARVATTGVEFIEDNPLEHLQAIQDMGRVQQILTNFVTNAVKYTKQGHIRVGYRLEGDGLYIYCEDTGQGIPKDKQATVFDRFVKLNDFVQGTGLGLSICRTIVERCGGRIGLDSEGDGKGSTFWVWMPLNVTV